jgi:hypothetical protein
MRNVQQKGENENYDISSKLAQIHLREISRILLVKKTEKKIPDNFKKSFHYLSKSKPKRLPVSRQEPAL